MTATCVRCGAPTDGWACQGCANRAGHHLNLIVDMTPVARDVAYMQIRQGPNTGGRTDPGLPIDLGATGRLSKVEDRLTRWCRQIAAKRGIVPPWVTTYGDPITAASGWLTGQIEWIRHQGPTTDHTWLHVFGWNPAEIDALDIDNPPVIASAFLAYIADAAQVIRGLARGPAEKRYLGPCGATVCEFCGVVGETHSCENFVYERTCEGDVYGRPDAELGTCRTCGAQVEQADRRAWLDGEVRGWAFRASEIAAAYGLKANTIRVWAARGHIEPFGHDREGRPLFRVGEVLDRAAADAARRETERAKRERRAAARAAESEDAA